MMARVGTGFGRTARLLSVAGLSAFLAMGLNACIEQKVILGKKPDVSVLEAKLRLGRSTRDHVRRILGPPTGHGRAMLPGVDEKPRNYWSYFFNISQLSTKFGTRKPATEALQYDSRHIYLFVYFDGEIYDGYMWFSSLETMGVKMP